MVNLQSQNQNSYINMQIINENHAKEINKEKKVIRKVIRKPLVTTTRVGQ